MTAQVVVLHTNDLHGALSAAMADRLAELKSRLRPALLLDSGDAVACGNLRTRPGGEPIHRLMSRAGYDAQALGNRESHVRAAPLQRKLSAATFPILCANVRRVQGGLPAPVADHLILEPVAGVRIGLTAVCVPMVRDEQWTARFCDLRYDRPVAALRARLPLPEVGATILLSHCGLDQDRELAAAGLGIDLILGGHSHTPLSPPEQVGHCWIVQNPPHGGGLAQLTLTFDAGRLAEVRWEPRRLGAAL